MIVTLMGGLPDMEPHRQLRLRNGDRKIISTLPGFDAEKMFEVQEKGNFGSISLIDLQIKSAD